MAENNIENEKPYIKEKIKKKNLPLGKWVLRILLVIFSAVLFGLAAGVAFVIAKPWAEKLGHEEEETTRGYEVVLPTYQQPATTVQETTTETAPTEEMSVEFSDNQMTWIRNQIGSVLKRYTLDVGDVSEADDSLAGLYKAAELSLVTLTGQTGDGNISMDGVAFYHADDADEILVLTDSVDIEKAGGVVAEFTAIPDRTFTGTVIGSDRVYNLCVVAVSTADMTEEEKAGICVLNLGNNYSLDECDRVLLIGRPYGGESVAVARITGRDEAVEYVDSVYSLYYTDTALPDTGRGFAIDLSGNLVGIVNRNLTGKNQAGLGSILGTDEITGALNCMANGTHASLLGVIGQTVSEQMMSEHNMPAGVYVSDVLADSPAYSAGLCAGDIITGISTSEISTLDDLTDELLEAHLPGETVIVRIMRDSADGYKEMELSVTLGSR